MSPNDLAYIAGYLDGEGCFTVSKGHRISVICETTHYDTIAWLHFNLGGVLITQKGRKANHRTTYRWAVVCKDALRVCELLNPYLREKREQAALLCMIQNLKGSPGKRVDPVLFEERERLTARVKLLKGRIRDVN